MCYRQSARNQQKEPAKLVKAEKIYVSAAQS